ncbi:hypothetical protein YK56LOC_68440 [Caballeronia sp. HLA56]
MIGDARQLERTFQIVRGDSKVHAISEASLARNVPSTIDCIDLGLISDELPFGELSALAGDAAYRCIAISIYRAGRRTGRGKQIDAICTAPLNEERCMREGTSIRATRKRLRI